MTLKSQDHGFTYCLVSWTLNNHPLFSSLIDRVRMTSGYLKRRLMAKSFTTIKEPKSPAGPSLTPRKGALKVEEQQIQPDKMAQARRNFVF